ncbi:hypothetical protein Bbelb_292570 [Branchiostoma belcheri]|nr:hypothetical protein Bbelb_292570 [Branchiostoma belcheri]
MASAGKVNVLNLPLDEQTLVHDCRLIDRYQQVVVDGDKSKPVKLEYASTVWGPHKRLHAQTNTLEDKVEAVQKRAARFVTGDYRPTTSMTDTLSTLGWPSLQERRQQARLVLMYKAVNNMVAIPIHNILTKNTNITRGHHSRFITIPCKTEAYRASYFPRTVIEWNALPDVDCDGCQVDHPSQRRHHCLFLDVEDMKEYGRRTLASMSFRKMYGDFFRLTAYLCELGQVPSVESMRQKAEDRGLKDETMASYEPPQKKPNKSHKKKGDSKAKRKLVLSEPQQPCLDDTVDIDELMKQPSKTVEGVQPIPSTVSPVGLFEMMSNIVSDNGAIGTGNGDVGTELPAKPATVDRCTTTFGAEPIPQPTTINGGFTTSLGVNKAEVRLPLSDNVFITAGVFNNRPLISIRQFYSRAWDPNTLKPGKKGLTFTPEQWRTLKDINCAETPHVLSGESEVRRGGDDRRSADGGSLAVRPSSRNQPQRAGSTQKGINLTLQQWEGVESKKETVDWIMDAVAKGKSPLDRLRSYVDCLVGSSIASVKTASICPLTTPGKWKNVALKCHCESGAVTVSITCGVSTKRSWDKRGLLEDSGANPVRLHVCRGTNVRIHQGAGMVSANRRKGRGKEQRSKPVEKKKKNADVTDEILRNVYYDPGNPAGFGGVGRLHQAVGSKHGITRQQVKDWLRPQDTYTLHTPIRRRFKSGRVVISGLNPQWQADLADLSSLAKHNDGYRYILTCIDVLSKFAWAVPIKDKKGLTLVEAFQSILDEGRKPWRCRRIKTLLKNEDIEFFTTFNAETKASVVERFNRTLKTRMWKYFTANNIHRYIDVLDNLLDAYNHSYHRSIKKAPVEVTKKNQRLVWHTLYVYRVTDYDGEELKGTFYEEELQKVSKKGLSGGENSRHETTRKYRHKLPRTKLAHPIELSGEWEVGLVEIQYPHSWLNVREVDEKVRGGNREYEIVKIPIGYYENVLHLVKTLNEAASTRYPDVFKNHDMFAYNSVTKRVTMVLPPMASNATTTTTYLVGPLAEKLGWGGKYAIYGSWMQAPRSPDPNLGFNSLYVYGDVVQHRLAGGVKVPLLRIIKIEGQDGDIYKMSGQRGGQLSVYHGRSMQCGYGLGGIFRGLLRSAVPLLKRGPKVSEDMP